MNSLIKSREQMDEINNKARSAMINIELHGDFIENMRSIRYSYERLKFIFEGGYGSLLTDWMYDKAYHKYQLLKYIFEGEEK